MDDKDKKSLEELLDELKEAGDEFLDGLKDAGDELIDEIFGKDNGKDQENQDQEEKGEPEPVASVVPEDDGPEFPAANPALAEKFHLPKDYPAPRTILKEHFPHQAEQFFYRGGWGYTPEDAVIVFETDDEINPGVAYSGVSLEYVFVEKRLKEEVNFAYQGDPKYRYIGNSRNDQALCDFNDKPHDMLNVTCHVMKQARYDELMAKYKEHNQYEGDDAGAKAFDDEFNASIESFEEVFWFDISNFFGNEAHLETPEEAAAREHAPNPIGPLNDDEFCAVCPVCLREHKLLKKEFLGKAYVCEECGVHFNTCEGVAPSCPNGHYFHPYSYGSKDSYFYASQKELKDIINRDKANLERLEKLLERNKAEIAWTEGLLARRIKEEGDRTEEDDR